MSGRDPDRSRGPASRLVRAELEERRRRFRATTPSERVRTCLELSELGSDLREAVRRRS